MTPWKIGQRQGPTCCASAMSPRKRNERSSWPWTATLKLCYVRVIASETSERRVGSVLNRTVSPRLRDSAQNLRSWDFRLSQSARQVEEIVFVEHLTSFDAGFPVDEVAQGVQRAVACLVALATPARRSTDAVGSAELTGCDPRAQALVDKRVTTASAGSGDGGLDWLRDLLPGTGTPSRARSRHVSR